MKHLSLTKNDSSSLQIPILPTPQSILLQTIVGDDDNHLLLNNNHPDALHDDSEGDMSPDSTMVSRSPFPILSMFVEPTSAPSSLIQELLAMKQQEDEEDEDELVPSYLFHIVADGEEQDPTRSLYYDSSIKDQLRRTSLCCSDHHRHSLCESRISSDLNAAPISSTTTVDFTTDTETKRRHQVELVSWDKVPPFLRNNPFILKYYRTYFSFSLCLKSLFLWHNETVNIWTHLIGVLVFAAFSLFTITSSIYRVWNGSRIYFADVCIMLVYECLAINCFLSSTLYHTFNCHSRKTWQVCYKCDLSGISGLIGGSFFPALYFQLRCYFAWQVVYISSIAVFALLGMVFPFIPVANKARAVKIFRIVRTLLFLCMVGSGIIPAAHWFIAMKPMQLTNSEYSLFAGLTAMLLLYGIGLVFWVFKLPERFYPGFFDLIGHSHNIWHVFIVLAAVTWWVFMNMMWSRSSTATCPSIVHSSPLSIIFTEMWKLISH